MKAVASPELHRTWLALAGGVTYLTEWFFIITTGTPDTDELTGRASELVAL